MELPHVGMPNAGEEADSDVSGKQAIGGIVVLIIFLALVLGIAGAALSYFVKGAGFAALLPFVRGDRWDGKGDHPHPGDVAAFVVAVVGFVVLWAAGVLK